MNLLIPFAIGAAVTGGFVALRYYQAYQRRNALLRKRQREADRQKIPVVFV